MANDTAREATLDAIKTDQQQLRDALTEANAIIDSVINHLIGEDDKAEVPSEARANPSGMLQQMCELGNDNQNSLNRLMGVIQQVSRLTGAA